MRFEIPITPVGQMRARHAVRGKHAMAYKDPKQQQREQTLELFLMANRPEVPLSGALKLRVKAYMPIPKSKSQKWKVKALSGEVRPTTKPDMDNLLKHLKDCLTNMRFWEDDKQVVEYLEGTGKYYSDSPRWEVEIVPLCESQGLLAQ